ncbi:MAG: PEP-CTERM sorting domain-containing protein, partial [Acidobacteriia bacterium]|nr:PEP-CTERM sorting domain-containing protein [Terriglobia bacterium]
GYGTALTSAPNVGFNKNGNPASITSATPFTVQSGVFAAAFNDGLTLFVTGKEGGVAVGTESFLLNTTMPELETFSFGAVTELDFFSLGGTENPSLVQYGSGTEFAVDNLAVTTVPEPSSIVLLSIGLAAVIFWGVGYANRFRSGCRRPEIQGTASEIWTPAPPEDRRPSFTCGELTSAYSSVAIKDPFR